MENLDFRYRYLGCKQTRPDLIGQLCNPIYRVDGKCVVSIPMATALVVFANGEKQIVLRRRLRLTSKEAV